MAQLNKESEGEDEDTTEEEDPLKDAEPEWDNLTDLEMDPPPSPKHTIETTNTPPTTTQPILTPSTQTNSGAPIQSPPQPETQPPLATQATQEKGNESLPSDVVTSSAAATVVADSTTNAMFSPSKKTWTKHTAKRRRLAKVPEENELDAEGVTAEEDQQEKATMDVVVQSLADAAAIEAAEKAEADKRAKESLEFVIAQKKASVSNVGLVVADTGSVLQQQKPRML